MSRSLERYADYCRRNHLYVDHALQRGLLVALVALEMLSIAVAIAALYVTLDGIIDANAWRVHFRGPADGLPAFLAAGVKVIIGIGVVNFIAIVVADRLWAWYVERIVGQLGILVRPVARLDLSPRPAARGAHAVLDRAADWRDDEAARLAAIRAVTRSLPASLPATVAEREQVLDRILTIANRACRDT